MARTKKLRLPKARGHATSSAETCAAGTQRAGTSNAARSASRPVAIRPNIAAHELDERGLRAKVQALHLLMSTSRELRRGVRHPRSAAELVSEINSFLAAIRVDKWKSAAFLRHAERLMRLGSWEADLTTKECFWSRGLYEIMKIDTFRPLAIPDFLNVMYPADREKVQASIDNAVAKRRPFEHTFRVTVSGEGPRFLRSRGQPVYDAKGKAIRLFGVCRDVTEQKRRGDQQRDADAKLARQLMHMRDDERRRLARQLHESAGQSLAALKMTIERLKDLLEQNSAAAAALLDSATELTEQAIREVRTTSYSMYPPMLSEVGVAPAVRWYLRGFALRSGIRIQAHIPDDFGRCSPEVETSLFHILQEALSNIHRHSGSATATVRLLRGEAGSVVAEVIDSGRGIALRASSGITTPAGVGIAGMRERARLLGGTLDVRSSPSEGTTVRAVLPAFVANDSPCAFSATIGS